MADEQTKTEDDRGRWAEFLVCLTFFSRLPVPKVDHDVDMSEAWWAAPLTGAIIGLVAALVLAFLVGLGMTPFLAAVFAVATLLVTTGALHEDGLSDVVDGFGGGATKDRKLEIMRDSRVGSYGAAAIGLSLMARVAALTTLAEAGGWAAAVSLIVSGAVSRYACVLVPRALPPAREDGLGHDIGVISSAAMTRGAIACIAMIVLGWALGVPLFALVFASIATTGVALAAISLAKSQVGGYTGDVQGAVQQATEIAFLSVLVMALAR